MYSPTESPVTQDTFATSSLPLLRWKSKCGKSTESESANLQFILTAAISINLRKRIIKMQITITFYGNVPAEFCQIKWLQINKYICSIIFLMCGGLTVSYFPTSIPAIRLTAECSASAGQCYAKKVGQAPP